MKPGDPNWFDAGAAGRPKILILGGYYPPAKRAGGPTRSVYEMTRYLSPYAFYVYCRDREFGTREKLPGITSNQWQKKGQAWVFYASFLRRTAPAILQLVENMRPDAIYICSFFAREPTIQLLCLRRMGLVRGVPLILAPHGEFSAGALSLKPKRKRIYLGFAKLLGLGRGLTWHAASPEEVESIRRVVGAKSEVVLAPNFPPAPSAEVVKCHAPKHEGRARLIFLSRISPEKNLLGALEILSRVQAPVCLDIYGPIEDPAYWALCQRSLRELPKHVTTFYRGSVDPDAVSGIMSQYDALLLPTLGENYGYVIVESWASATPVLVSDRTPWTDLEVVRAGWSIPLENPLLFARRIDQLAEMTETEHAEWRSGSLDRLRRLQEEDLEEAYARLFSSAIASSKNRGMDE